MYPGRGHAWVCCLIFLNAASRHSEGHFCVETWGLERSGESHDEIDKDTFRSKDVLQNP
jgi:hypothetical protein